MKKRMIYLSIVFILGFYSGVWPGYAQQDFPDFSIDETLNLVEEEKWQSSSIDEDRGFGASSYEEAVVPSSLGASSSSSIAHQVSYELGQDNETSNQESLLLDVLELKDMDMMDVLRLIANKSGLNIVAGANVRGKVTIYLKNVDVYDALRIILEANGLAYAEESGIIKVMTNKDFEARYGYIFGQETETRIVKVYNVPAVDLVASLNQIKTATGVVVADTHSNSLILTDRADKIIFMKNFIEKADIPIVTEFFVLKYGKAESLAKQIEATLTENIGKIEWDERTNRIMVKDTPEKISRIKRLVEAFDDREPEVLIEAKILQVNLSDEFKLGIDWEAVVSNYHSLTFKSAFEVIGEDTDEVTYKKGTMSIGSLSSDDYDVLIEALQTVGETKTLSNPRIAVLNNHEAKILVGSTEPYITSETVSTTGLPVTSETVNFIDVGVKLFVTPRIHGDGYITMAIRPEVSNAPTSTETASGNFIPVVQTSQAETTVTIKDGVTIVLGGLIKEETSDDFKKVPILGDIPILGFAFRSKSKEKTKTELVIFLTATIITGDVSVEVKPSVSRTP
jgi:MSHA type pilus biogenesis protein MshL